MLRPGAHVPGVDPGTVGFANFDVKVDPRTGAFRFFEVNPRIGRNNYYVTAAGANPMRFVVEDQVDGLAVGARRGGPGDPLLGGAEPAAAPLRTRSAARRAGPAAHQGEVGGAAVGRTVRDLSPRRRLYVWMALVNQVREFRRYYPEVTSRASE